METLPVIRESRFDNSSGFQLKERGVYLCSVGAEADEMDEPYLYAGLVGASQGF